MRYILDHPIIGIVLALLGLLIGIASLIKPEYPWVKSAEICGTKSEMVKAQPHEFKECKHPSHGISAYQYEETVTSSSGWRGGGYNPVSWCNDVKRAKEKSIGQSIIWANPKYREESKKNILGEVSYNYHCTITGKWSPIYHLARSSACGVAEPAMIEKTEALSCYDLSKRIGWKWIWQ